MMLFNYVFEPNSNLLCCICRMPFVDPVTTRTCAHTFCRDCIVQAISHAALCPVDRSPLSLDDIYPANAIIRSLVDELVVECIHRSSGCTHTCQRQLLTAHVMMPCPFSRLSFPDEESNEITAKNDTEPLTPGKHTLAPCDLCGAEYQLDDLPIHLSECQESFVTCEFCVLELPRCDLASHKPICPEAIVPCPQASNGCGWSGPRVTLTSSHQESCPYEAIKGFFALNNIKFAQVTEENLILRHKIGALESSLQIAKRDLQSAKTALGPWYRPDGVHPLTATAYRTMSPPSTELSPELQPASASTSTNPSFTPSHARRFSSLTNDAPTSPDHNLAPYFPPITEDYRASEIAARRRTLPAGWEPASPFGNTGTGSQHTQVAPLNLSTTLEGALDGVRESVVTLGSAVDSLGRRNDIALTNETLRLNEEIMSLRANVHGLRMQVHTIMMDRNAQVTGRSPDTQSFNAGLNILGMGGMGDGTFPPPIAPRGFYGYGHPQAMSPGGLGQSTTKL
ncbi:TRAF-type zinc finger protein [Favolaschia claudopus]|uniref:TRAF-type zinc finger protein n=1 Tax=Favolaschia claudopus TaxID=2862362 RepID=A0AAW0A9X7_9AGAR